MKILLIDDDSTILDVMGDLLRSRGHDVETACDGQEGIEKLFGGARFDLFITDLNMPRLDGYGFACKARKMTDAPILLHTGEVQPQMKEGVSAIIDKGNMKQIKKWLNNVWPTYRGCE